MRVGLGFDVHEFKTGRKLILGGVELEHTEGLAGYSDADVLVHSIMDAILGACGLGDIGIHFLETDSENQQVEIGYTLDKEFRGKGYATEALSLVIDFLINSLMKHHLPR